MSILVAQKAPGLSNDNWRTPSALLDDVRRFAPIALDPCTHPSNPTGARAFCVEPTPANRAGRFICDGLAQDWVALSRGGLGWVNSPYSLGNLDRWTAKCQQEAKRGMEIIALVPVDTSTAWWRHRCTPPVAARAVCFIFGRLTFIGAPGAASFASALVYFGLRVRAFSRAFAGLGAVWT